MQKNKLAYAQLDELDEQVERVIQDWLEEGTAIGRESMPIHPEFVYRMSGDWTGWNQFCGVKPDDVAFEENRLTDVVEDVAFGRFAFSETKITKIDSNSRKS